MNQVQDTGALKSFLQKRTAWFSWYDVHPDEPNSILNQIHLMVLSEMSYRVMLEEQKHATDKDSTAIPLLAHLVVSGYFSSQILAIRRLFDHADDVISLRRVLNDVKAHRHLLTREIFVSFDGTPYEQPRPAAIIRELQPVGSPFSLHRRSKQRHERFDLLAKVSSATRSRFDRVHLDIFSKLDAWLDNSGAQRLIKLSHKYLAHAADPSSRKNIKLTGLAFSEVESIQMAIIRTCRAIFDIILISGVHSPVVPLVPLGYFGRVWDGDKMVVSTSRMQDHWDKLEKIRNKWPENLDVDLCA